MILNRPNKPLLFAIGLLLAAAVTAQPVCSINLGPDQTICQGQTAQLMGPPGYTNYLWSTGANSQDLTVGTAGNYWGEVSYNSGNLVTNGNFSAGNTGFTSEWNYNTDLTQEGTYFVDNVSTPHHPQFSGTGNGLFMIVNAGWGAVVLTMFDVWCQNITVCPGQTYTLSYRGRTLSNATPARLQWHVDGGAVGPEVLLPTFNAGWQTINQTWTAGPGQTSANFCLRVTSGEGVGNDFGLDDISISGTIVLRDYVQVNVTPLPVVNLGPDVTLCAGTPLILNAAVPGGTYLWQNGAVTPTFNVLTAGNYSVIVTANGCSNSDNINVNYNPYPVVDIGPDVTLCAGQQLVLDATQPGATYSWQNNSTAPTYTVSAAGTFDVDVTVNGCTTNDAITVSYTPLPIVNLGADITICDGEVAVLNATLPGGSYVWQDGSGNPVFNATIAGTYSVDVTVNGCSASDAVNIAVTPNPIVDLGADEVLCDGDQLVIDATTPGATYSWQDNSTGPTYTASTSGTYDVDVTVNGCTSNDAINVNFDPVPVVNLGADLVICQGDPLQLDATVPGATYLWQDGSTGPTFDVIATGTYDVTVTLGNCPASDAITVTVNPNPIVGLGADAILCDGDLLVIDATVPGATYLWQDNSTGPTFTASTPGTYDVDVTVNGCTTNDAINVNFDPVPVVNLGADLVICQGDPLQLDATVPGTSYLWQDGSTGPTFDVIAAGTYDVTVTLGNCPASDAITVTVNPNPIVDLGTDAILCDGDQLVLDATIPGAAYVWQDNSTGPTFTASTSGTYDVDVTVNGCTTNDAINVTFDPMPVVDLGPDLSVCQGTPVQLDATVMGATYSWQNGSTDPTFDVNSSGNYSVLVSLGSCSASDAITVTVSPSSNVNLGADAFLCVGDQLILNATMPGATYSWQDNSTGPTFTATTTGTYDVDVTVNGCTTNDAVNVTFNPVPVVDLGPDLTICQGDPLQLDATSPGVSYLWQDGSTDPTFDVTGSGTYSVQLSLGSCGASDAINVTVIPAPIVNIGADAALCDGDQLVIDATMPGATYIWQDNSTGPSFTATTTGTYAVDVTVNGCTTNDAINVTFDPMPVVDLGPDISVCQGTPVQLDATVGGATYSWQNGSTDPTFDVSGSGNYSVLVSLGSCSASDEITVTVNPIPNVNLGADSFLCEGDQLNLDATTPGATYSWQDNSTGPTFTATTTGTYAVDVTVNGCTSNDAVNVTFNPVPVVDLGPDLTICQGDPLQLDASSPGVSYLWQDGSTNPTFDVTGSGTYSVQLSLGSCGASDAINVTVNPVPVVELGADVVICPGDEATFDVSAPGATYLWQDNSTGATFTTDQAGNYSVTVNANGCSSSDQVTVAIFDLQGIDLGPDAMICDGAVMTLDATLAGSTYLWSTGATTASIDVSTSGLYSVDVMQSGCSATDAITIDMLPTPTVDLGNDTTLCDQSALTLDALYPGATYAWSTGSSDASIIVSAPAIYSVIVDLNGCTATDTIDVAYISALSLNIGNDTTLCPDAELVLNASLPGGTTVWSTNTVATSITVSEPGIYWATVTVSGCAVSDSITVAQVPLPTLDLGDDAAICQGEAVSFDITIPSATYLWDDGSTGPVRTIDAAGEYWAHITLSGCITSDTFNLVLVPLPAVDLGADTGLCAQNTLLLDATSPGAAYLWSNGSVQASVIAGPGAWGVQVTANGCSASDAIVIDALPTPVLNWAEDTTLCTGTVWLIDAEQSGAMYIWHDGSTASGYLVDQPGSYAVEVSIGACSVNDQVQVSYFDDSLVNLGPDTTLCPGEELVLTLTLPNVDLLWPDGSSGSSFTVTSAGVYSVSANANGCTATDAIQISYTPLPQPDLGPDRTLCEGDSLILSVQPASASVLWNSGSTGDSLLVTMNNPVQVTLELDGCVSSDAVQVTFLPVVDRIDLGPDATICLGDELVLDATVHNAFYGWNTGEDAARIQVLMPGIYHVVVSGPCINAADTIVITEGNCAPLVYVPNGFTPNGDGINELFVPVTTGNFRLYTFLIFDRWGENIFSSDTPGEPWDGKVNGSPVQDGVYVWQLSYKAVGDQGVKQERLTGSVTLLR